MIADILVALDIFFQIQSMIFVFDMCEYLGAFCYLQQLSISVTWLKYE